MMWWVFYIPVPYGACEDAIADLTEVSSRGVEIRQDEILVYTENHDVLDDLGKKIVHWRKKWFSGLEGLSSIRVESIADENWEENWKKYFKPLPIGKTWLVCPSWEKCAATPERIVLIIDPGRAYGTGRCPTTALCLELLESLPNDTTFWKKTGALQVLDVGTGTGILAIAASKLGAQVTGVDIDPIALEVAGKNCRMNNVNVQLDFPENTVLDSTFQLLMANLTSHMLMKLREELTCRLSKNSRIILSGVLRKQINAVLEAYDEMGWYLYARGDREDWSAVILTNDVEI